MAIKWATAVWNYALQPSLVLHKRYWHYKVALDKTLEQKVWYFNVGLGLIFGGTLYLLASPMQPAKLQLSRSQLQDDVDEVLKLLLVDPKKEFPGQTINRYRREMLTKLHLTNDRVAVKQAQAEVKALRERFDREKAAIMAKGAATPQAQ